MGSNVGLDRMMWAERPFILSLVFTLGIYVPISFTMQCPHVA